jgi:hypothetical protein
MKCTSCGTSGISMARVSLLDLEVSQRCTLVFFYDSIRCGRTLSWEVWLKGCTTVMLSTANNERALWWLLYHWLPGHVSLVFLTR